MKRNNLLKHLRFNGCYLKREGASHSLWCNPQTGHSEAVPRHTEIPNRLAKKICRASFNKKKSDNVPEVLGDIKALHPVPKARAFFVSAISV